MKRLIQDLEETKALFSEKTREGAFILNELGEIETESDEETCTYSFLLQAIRILPYSGINSRVILHKILQYKLNDIILDTLTSTIHKIPDIDCQRAALIYCCKALPRTQLKNLLKSLFQIKIKNYDFEPLPCIDHHPGLVNLGSLCYMNSIIQIFYSLPSFVQLYFNSPNLSPTYEAFTKVLYTMNCTVYPAVNPVEFVSRFTWRGGQQLNLHQQQDAFEFFQFFLQNSNAYEAAAQFCGTLCSTISNESCNLSNKIFQNFYGLSIPIRNRKKLEEVISTFSLPERLTGDDRYLYNDTLIEADKVTYITESPPVLVFHLERFYYDIEKKCEMKINDPFSFPNEIDISPCTKDVELTKYKLHGVVIHNGTAVGGHYAAIVKYNDKWIKFSDTTMTKLSQKDFDTYTIGSKSSRTNAYLLVYTRNDYETFDPFINVPHDIMEFIENDNLYYQQMMFAMSEPFIAVSLKYIDTKEFYPYLFNVLSHCKTLRSMTKIIVEKVVMDHPNNVIQQIIKNIQVVVGVFSSGSIEVKLLFTSIISKCIYKVDTKDAMKVFNSLFVEMKNILSSYRNVPYVFIIMTVYLSAMDSNKKVAEKEGWILLLMKFLEIIYAKKQTDTYIKNVEIIDLLDCFRLLVDCIDEKAISLLNELSPKIKKNKKNVPNYEKLMTLITSKQSKPSTDEKLDQKEGSQNNENENKTDAKKEEEKCDEKTKDEKIKSEDKKEEGKRDENIEKEKDKSEDRKNEIEVKKELVKIDFVSLLLTETNDNKMKETIENQGMDPTKFLNMLIEHSNDYEKIAMRANVLFLHYLLAGYEEYHSLASKLCRSLPQHSLALSFIKKLSDEDVIKKYHEDFFNEFSLAISHSEIDLDSTNKEISNFIGSIKSLEFNTLLQILKALLVFRNEEIKKEIRQILTFTEENYRKSVELMLNVSRDDFFEFMFQDFEISSIWQLKILREILGNLELSQKEIEIGQKWIVSIFNRYDDYNDDEQSKLISSVKHLLKFFIAKSIVNSKCFKHILLELDGSEQIYFIPFFACFDNFVDSMKKVNEFASNSLIFYHKLIQKVSDEEALKYMIEFTEAADEIDDYVDDNSIFGVALLLKDYYTEAFIQYTMQYFSKTVFDYPNEEEFYSFCFSKMTEEQIDQLIAKCMTSKKPKDHGFKKYFQRIAFICQYIPTIKQKIRNEIKFTKEECEDLPKKLKSQLGYIFD